MTITPNYFNRNLFILIPLVGIIIVGVFLISYGVTDAGDSLKFFIHGIVITCRVMAGMHDNCNVPLEEVSLGTGAFQSPYTRDSTYTCLYHCHSAHCFTSLRKDSGMYMRLKISGWRYLPLYLLRFLLLQFMNRSSSTSNGNITFQNLSDWKKIILRPGMKP